jgi:hypothetical protein
MNTVQCTASRGGCNMSTVQCTASRGGCNMSTVQCTASRGGCNMNRRVRIESLQLHCSCTVDSLSRKVGTKSKDVVQYSEQVSMGRRQERMGGGKGPNGLQAKEAGQLEREIRQWAGEALWQAGEVAL